MSPSMLFFLSLPISHGSVDFYRLNITDVVEASLHVHWDTYGTFCFVPAEANVVTMLKALRQSNQDWEDVVRLNPSLNHLPSRCNSRALQQTHVARRRPASLCHAPRMPATPHRAEPNLPSARAAASDMDLLDPLLAASPPHEPLPPFPASDIRDSLLNPAISSLAMVINAHSKLEVFMRDHGAAAAPRIQRYAQLMSDLVTEIFFVPEGMGSVAGHTNRTTGQSPGAGHEHGGTNPHGRKQETPGPADTDSADAPEPPAEDGLTDTELRLVEAQALLPRNARMRR
ncbi:hypothetical protein OE88DRAFT_1808638 [Heliocybe sulcata]|uniref:Uncharacterized protein n=1 Tax=Heliocybe sulcata TaxID=5364 RepID=A0A5C3NBC8_9AGAM|nr:hypothetical protein OE88DRAFT_1808638 [Heliocybe sulcata]